MTFAAGILVGVLGTLILSLVAGIVLMRAARPQSLCSPEIRAWQAAEGARFADSLSQKN